MNCDTCPHMKRIKAALSPCQRCRVGEVRNATPLADGLDAPLSYRRWDENKDPSPHEVEGVTALPPDTEDALRKYLSSMFGLSPIKLLLVQHTMNGGTFASFSDTLGALSVELARKAKSINGRSFRSVAQVWADDIVSQIPQLSDAFAAVVDRNRGHSTLLSAKKRYRTAEDE